MSPLAFEERIVHWARRKEQVNALILAGSRALSSNSIDRFSDWDFHIISQTPEYFYRCDWVSEIAPVWCCNCFRTPRGVVKVSVIFAGGFEVDFIPLAAWKMKLVYWAMGHPQLASVMPRKLLTGISETRTFLLGSGFRILVGGDSWAKRLRATEAAWPKAHLEFHDFTAKTGSFWQKATWVTKKIARPEPRSAMHWLHLLVVGELYDLLAEEARLSGSEPRPEARKAEHWLSSARLQQTMLTTSTDQSVLARALLSQLDLFEDVSRVVAERRGFILPDYSELSAWMRTELRPIADRGQS